MVLFLRPTESPVVFLQQLGRGLRKVKGKEYLNVLDFIGNYKKAGQAPFLLSGMSREEGKGSGNLRDLEFPEDCLVDFDMRLIDLFREMDQRSLTLRERIRQEYYRVKEMLDGKVPSRMELFTYMEDDIYQLCMRNTKENPFRRYFDYLHELGELSKEEKSFYDGIGREFLVIIETTEMQKAYKMPILYSIYNHGDIRMQVTEEEVLSAWKYFFSTGTNWKDVAGSYEEYKGITDRQHLSTAKRNLIRFLKAFGKGFFVEREG